MVRSFDSKKNNKENAGDECIWSQAGVLKQQFCDKAYNCNKCDIERDLSKAARENQLAKAAGKEPTGSSAHIIHWREKIKEKPVGKQHCLHYMKGQIDYRNCTNDYHCINCDFDQYFYDQYSVHAVVKPIDMLNISGFKIPQGYYYHKGHSWTKLEENSEVRIGVDDFAYRVLGPPDRIETPLLGKELKQGEEKIVFTRGNNRVSFPSPISGIITAVNHKLFEEGSLAHSSPYTDGWILRVHASDLRKDLKNLSMGPETEQELSNNIDRLYQLIETLDKPLAADGGNLVNDLHGALPELRWSRLVQTFFKSR